VAEIESESGGLEHPNHTSFSAVIQSNFSEQVKTVE